MCLDLLGLIFLALELAAIFCFSVVNKLIHVWSLSFDQRDIGETTFPPESENLLFIVWGIGLWQPGCKCADVGNDDPYCIQVMTPIVFK